MQLYSFKSVSGAFSHPDVGAFSFAGQVGMGQMTVENATERTAHDVAADGTVMVSYVAGDNGSAVIEIQQTSQLHAFLLGWYNTIKTNADAGDPTNWAAATLTIRNLLDGSGHVLTGISPSKNPPKPYGAQGQKVTWTLMAADVQSS